MQERFEETFIHHCAPTLAGHKAGSLFCWRVQGDDLTGRLKALETELAHKGVRIRQLCRCEQARQVYVYRPAMLQALLRQSEVARFLTGLGYHSLEDTESVLEQLFSRFQAQPLFPHEVGLFLGYPLADVQGFMEHGGRNYLIKGPWKVYAEAEEGRRRFDLFLKCREVYLRRYREGRPIARLTVAA